MITSIMVAAAMFAAPPISAGGPSAFERIESYRVAAKTGCKKYLSCRQAVEAWCAGIHPGADRDEDGIPCENVCKSRKQVVAIEKEIGCSK